jgi:signal transduction histidine kinase
MPRLATFIRENSKAIIRDWENFARKLIPAADAMGPLSLRDHIVDILTFIANDIESSQTDAEQLEKSHGERPRLPTNTIGEIHAALRQAGGFDLDQMVSEYRALRASIIKIWQEQEPETNSEHISDMIRFNEAIDQTLSDSISFYTKKVDHSRTLLLGILGHDLRNPVGAMLMAAQLVAKIGPLNERQSMLISQVVTSADRVTELLDQLLDITHARVGSGLAIIREQMDMAFVGRQLVDEARAVHPKCKFTIEVSGNTEGSWDKPRIGQVFSNLIGNAVQYGFSDLPITVKIIGGPDDVVLTVHNEGVPIAKDEIGRIFDALIRGETDASDHPSSVNLGLGLYITKEIVTAHRGTIDVTSTEKYGTTFSAHFPRKPNKPSLGAAPEIAGAQNTNHRPQSLIRDDDAA